MSELILTGGSLKMTDTNTPTRAGEVIATLAEMENIPTPRVGMSVYVADEDREYIVTALSEKTIAGVVVPNAMVSGYRMAARKSDVDEEAARATTREGELEQAIRNNAEGVNTAKADILTNRSAISVVDNKANANSLRIEEVATTTNSRIETEVSKINKKISDEIAKVVGGAPESFDTLQEIAGWIENDETGAAAISNAVTENANDITRLMKAVFPLKVSMSVSSSGTLEYSGGEELVTVSWNATIDNVKVDDVESIVIAYGGMSENLATSASSHVISVSNDTVVTLTVRAKGMTATAQAKVNFAYRWFSGVVDGDFVVNESNIKALPQQGVTDSRVNSVSYAPFTLKKVVYAYAVEYGALSGIVDLNNINLINNYSKSSISIGGVNYNVYITKEDFSVEGNITYKYQ